MWETWLRRGLRTGSGALGVIAIVVLLGLAFSEDADLAGLAAPDDKLAHVLGFGVLGVLFTLATGRAEFWFWTFGLAFVAGAIELLQPLLTASREGSTADAGASLLGLAIGVSCAGAFNCLRERRLGQQHINRSGEQPPEHD